MTTKTMTGRERIAAAAARHESDVLPIGFKATDDILERLRSHFGVERMGDLLDALDVDTFGNFNNCNYGVWPRYIGGPPKVLYPDQSTDGTWDTIYGYRRRWVAAGGGRNDEVLDHPLADASIDEIDRHAWPQVDWFDFADLPRQCDAAGDRANLFNLGGLGHVSNLIGFERLMMELLADPPFIDRCLDRITDFYVALLDRVLEAADGRIDVVCIHDDFGTQHGPLMGFDEYRRFYKARHQSIFEVAHHHGVATMMHSCGAIFDFIPEFIEIGADILDPIQVTAAGMEPSRLKKAYGDAICFHGGIDTQKTLVQGSPDDVRRHIDDLVDALADGGGFVLAPSHYIQGDVPLENVLAIFEHTAALRGRAED